MPSDLIARLTAATEPSLELRDAEYFRRKAIKFMFEAAVWFCAAAAFSTFNQWFAGAYVALGFMALGMCWYSAELRALGVG